MRTALKLISFTGLGLTVIPSFLVFAGAIAIGIQITPHRDAREWIEGVSLATRRGSLHLVAGGTDLRDVCAAHAVDRDA